MKHIRSLLTAVLAAVMLASASTPALAAEDALSRGEAVAQLWSAAGSPAAAASGAFADVDPGSPYRAAIDWAAAQGVVRGFSDGTFRPDDTLSRGQLALILQRYETTALTVAKQGMFSSGGTVTEPVPGAYDPTTNWLDVTRAGNTAHVDHANVLYQIPARSNGRPMVFLHGYGQSRMGWMTTPDGRPGWSDLFLRDGYSVFLVDQPHRGEAGAAVTMTNDGFLDAWAADSKDYKPGDQAWYTHFRIGRVAPERYEGSQFPAGQEAQDQFFRQMTPNTGAANDAEIPALTAVLEDVWEMTGEKSIFITHSAGGRVGWNVDMDHVAAIIAVEPGGAPEVGSDQYKALLAAKVPILFYFGDYIDNGPEDIQSTAFWRAIRDGARSFAQQYNADGGDATVIDLPQIGITGNSHFLFQELNNDVIAAHAERWLSERGLA
ncbi:MAG: S-layer homology domain-containing protein [Oscillibacter sp.]|nr:S-layer homology domain-containing protein [Oscillibacter sp.]